MNKNPQYTIRQATIKDLHTLRHFEQEIVKAERAFTDRLIERDIQYYDLDALVGAKTACVLVASVDDVLIGCGLARIERDKPHFTPNEHAYLGLMFVDPDWRGQGVVQDIMTALMDWSRAMGMDVCKLDVFAQNSAAIRAYEKLGFRAEMIEMVRLELRD